jgi:hypothetical protein
VRAAAPEATYDIGFAAIISNIVVARCFTRDLAPANLGGSSDS